MLIDSCGMAKHPNTWQTIWVPKAPSLTIHISWFYTGWWLGHPSEKYEFVNWDDEIPNGKIIQMATIHHQPVYDQWLSMYDAWICRFLDAARSQRNLAIFCRPWNKGGIVLWENPQEKISTMCITLYNYTYFNKVTKFSRRVSCNFSKNQMGDGG